MKHGFMYLTIVSSCFLLLVSLSEQLHFASARILTRNESNDKNRYDLSHSLPLTSPNHSLTPTFNSKIIAIPGLGMLPVTATSTEENCRSYVLSHRPHQNSYSICLPDEIKIENCLRNGFILLFTCCFSL